MIVDIATKNLSQNFLKGFEEVKNDFKVMKKIQCKGGKPYMMSVRTADLKQEKRKKKKKKASDPKNDGIVSNCTGMMGFGSKLTLDLGLCLLSYSALCCGCAAHEHLLGGARPPIMRYAYVM